MGVNGKVPSDRAIAFKVRVDMCKFFLMGKHVTLSLPKGLKSLTGVRLKARNKVAGLEFRCFGFAQHDNRL